MISREALGTLIKKVREKRKMSITELSRKSGVSRITIYKQEAGIIYMHLDTLDLVFKALGYRFVLGGSKDNG